MSISCGSASATPPIRSKERFLEDCGGGVYQLRDHVSTQRRIAEFFADSPGAATGIRDGLLDCASEVLFFEVPGSHGTLFHPRCAMQTTRSYQELDADDRWRVEQLYIDYFYRRQEDFWQARGYEKLPAMRRASPMLLCGEDLGMVPACVPGVLKELGILSLEIQRMPKTHEIEFFDPKDAPYMSVVSPSTHDMPTLARLVEGGLPDDRPLRLADVRDRLSGGGTLGRTRRPASSGSTSTRRPCGRFSRCRTCSPSTRSIRHPEPEAERINVPAIMPFYWRYRMHLSLDELAAARGFNERLASLIHRAGR